MKAEPSHIFRKLRQKYLSLMWGEIMMFSLAAACLVFGVTSLPSIDLSARLVVALVSGVMLGGVLWVTSKRYRTDVNRLVSFVNAQHPLMQYSTDLLLKDSESLTSLEQIQKEIVRQHFDQISHTIRFPHQLRKASMVLGASVVVMFLFILLPKQTLRDQPENISHSGDPAPSTRIPASLKQMVVKVAPPAYTNIKAYTSRVLNLTVPEGSRVQWEFEFSDSIQDPVLVFLHHDSLKLLFNTGTYSGQKSFQESNIYQLSWKDGPATSRTSEYFKAEVIRDHPPNIVVPPQPESREVRLDEKQSIPLNVNLSDDYGLKDAYIIATVSRGSGESVKFREERLSFTSPQKVSGRRAEVTRMIDLEALGLEPGDELYFYVEALDNKTPANRARTQTYFISVLDTATQTLSVEAGLGVDLMPAYFRSQRQIIIDSEKLLRDRKAISQQEFNARSNEIGYDQKVLRLKYGEFLGEEFETNIGPGAEAHEEADHPHEEEAESDPTAAYKHVHDDPEEATFFTQSIRARLKAALSAMWDAELHLRTFDPKNSLPYQYAALRILKAISQDSRIYVHRTGFDPPPLKEEKRLTGDLSEIKTRAYSQTVSDDLSYPGIRSALAIIENWLTTPDAPLTTSERQTLHRAGQELATVALNEPGRYLRAMSVIQSVAENEIPREDLRKEFLFLRTAFWKVLPAGMASPDKGSQAVHSLDRALIDHLKITAP